MISCLDALVTAATMPKKTRSDIKMTTIGTGELLGNSSLIVSHHKIQMGVSWSRTMTTMLMTNLAVSTRPWLRLKAFESVASVFFKPNSACACQSTFADA